MLFTSLRDAGQQSQSWSWDQIQPYYQDLMARRLDAATVDGWLKDWSILRELISESYNRLYVSTTLATDSPSVTQRYIEFLDQVVSASLQAEHQLKEKLIASGLQPAGFEMPLRNLQAEVDIYREENVSLLTQELKLNTEYDQIIGAQTIEWEGKETTISQLLPVYLNIDRAVRERAWRQAADRQLADRRKLGDLWVRLMDARQQLAANAGRKDYRDYRWQQSLRFDYTPEDCHRFCQAIEQVVVPAAARLFEKRRQRLGLPSLRPWDLDVDLLGRAPLKPFQSIEELIEKTGAIFRQLDPTLGDYFQIMRQEKLMDLVNRKGKAPGGYCIDYPLVRRPFIFANFVGLQDDVQTLFHESGHAFHVFETSRLPYYHQMQVGMEMAEVASMSMELLAAPYLSADHQGFYSPGEAARARIEHMEVIIRFWPYMAVVDQFQHWAYEHPEQASDPDRCDACWSELWRRYMVGVDWSGLEDAMATGWQRKAHIFQQPFYYIEYGMAQLAAIQVWRNAVENQSEAVSHYRNALSLGATRPLPELYQAAGARFSFDAATLQSSIDLLEGTIDELETLSLTP